ncbi:hypothetical protein I5H55_gp47 [Mycobacterium phage Krakatau]|uniref:Uncharacterized protein n=1 Tax=Mycobacterium phage Krakatau TaxID=2283296 RepID=A0A345MGZ1_9CAUD|nr:hypothetical protein I5H55_gp47 [Mycobacterium phage Krakatau]AXH69822.1 hypothetical protein SEA_KRAKATAU_47 [Mycobacterium phage Krakatau]
MTFHSRPKPKKPLFQSKPKDPK